MSVCITLQVWATGKQNWTRGSYHLVRFYRDVCIRTERIIPIKPKMGKKVNEVWGRSSIANHWSTLGSLLFVRDLSRSAVLLESCSPNTVSDAPYYACAVQCDRLVALRQTYSFLCLTILLCASLLGTEKNCVRSHQFDAKLTGHWNIRLL